MTSSRRHRLGTKVLAVALVSLAAVVLFGRLPAIWAPLVPAVIVLWLATKLMFLGFELLIAEARGSIGLNACSR